MKLKLISALLIGVFASAYATELKTVNQLYNAGKTAPEDMYKEGEDGAVLQQKGHQKLDRATKGVYNSRASQELGRNAQATLVGDPNNPASVNGSMKAKALNQQVKTDEERQLMQDINVKTSEAEAKARSLTPKDKEAQDSTVLIFCLMLPSKVSECMPYLKRYFSIKKPHKRLKLLIPGRRFIARGEQVNQGIIGKATQITYNDMNASAMDPEQKELLKKNLIESRRIEKQSHSVAEKRYINDLMNNAEKQQTSCNAGEYDPNEMQEVQDVIPAPTADNPNGAKMSGVKKTIRTVPYRLQYETWGSETDTRKLPISIDWDRSDSGYTGSQCRRQYGLAPGCGQPQASRWGDGLNSRVERLNVKWKCGRKGRYTCNKYYLRTIPYVPQECVDQAKLNITQVLPKYDAQKCMSGRWFNEEDFIRGYYTDEKGQRVDIPHDCWADDIQKQEEVNLKYKEYERASTKRIMENAQQTKEDPAITMRKIKELGYPKEYKGDYQYIDKMPNFGNEGRSQEAIDAENKPLVIEQPKKLGYYGE